MTNTPTTLDTIAPDQLDSITGGAGIGSQIGSMFGEKGAQWGGIADNIIGMIGGAAGGAGGAGGGLGGLLGGLGKLGGGAAPAGGAPGAQQPQQPGAAG